MSSPRRIVVIGGGISGLVVAHALKCSHRVPAHVTVLEAAERVGGWLSSDRRDGFLFENGCRGVRPVGRGRAALSLIETLGLQRETLCSSDAARKRYLIQRGTLVALPATMTGLMLSPLTRAIPLHALRELFDSPKDGSREDESVSSFVSRHFGRNAADVLADAALSGVYAGDVRQLSAKSVLSALWEYETSHGSVIRGAGSEALRNDDKGSSSSGKVSAFVAACQKSSSISFVDGMGALPRALLSSFLSSPASSVETGAVVTGVIDQHQSATGDPTGDPTSFAGPLSVNYTARGEQRSIAADRVVFALPAAHLARIVHSSGAHGCAGLVTSLSDIPTASVGVVCLGFRKGGLLPVSGFGYLIPRRERHWRGERAISDNAAGAEGGGTGVLGMTWDSEVFPGQHAQFADAVHGRNVAPPRDARTGSWLPHTLVEGSVPRGIRDETRLTVMIGGATAPWVASANKSELEEIALRAAREHLGLIEDPACVAVSVARSAIPQYTIGHAERVRAIREGINALYGAGRARMVGNSYEGIGVADTVARALQTAADLAAEGW